MNELKSKVSIPRMKKELQSILDGEKIRGEVVGCANGPRVTLFRISLEPGVNVKKVERCAKEIAATFNVPSVRVLAPIPGTKFVGVEIPNGREEMVDLRRLLEDGDRAKQMTIPLVLGKGFSGKNVVIDLALAPHILLAGVDPSEVSMGLHAMVTSLLYRFSPESMQLVLFHPQENVFDRYQGTPHLSMPVIHDVSQMIETLHKTVIEMEDRYKILQSVKAKSLREYNERNNIPNTPQSTTLPWKILFIGELASLQKEKSWNDAEIDICRIAQKGRAAGIHLVVATQYPTSKNIITGLIKANLPMRIAFRVNNVNESQLILDRSGAEKLLGGGDMLVMPYYTPIVRAQCASCKE
ncbi:MAG: hypothetical protein J5944_13580 [Lentisphaeria bacterium]|nr:hypothetical protein [Lentisphaeria bacterium]